MRMSRMLIPRLSQIRRDFGSPEYDGLGRD